MSATDLSAPSPSPSATASKPRVAQAPRPDVAATWVRVAVVCAILLGSAAVRWRQARVIGEKLERGRLGPQVKLVDVPLTLGAWTGKATDLDPLIARATGADQIVTRRYVNQDTGVIIDMILLYGKAVDMYTHAPEVCYPAAGYATVAGPEYRVIKSGDRSVPFKALVYSKGEAGVGELQEVYYTWRYQGLWSPDVGKQKHFERIPSMYKIHLARRLTSGERRDVGNPCESLLRELLPEMERRMVATQSHPS